MIPSELEKQIKQDQNEGLIPWVLVGTAGVSFEMSTTKINEQQK